MKVFKGKMLCSMGPLCPLRLKGCQPHLDKIVWDVEDLKRDEKEVIILGLYCNWTVLCPLESVSLPQF